MKVDETVKDLVDRKAESRAFLRSLSPEDKIARLVDLQQQYFSVLKAREASGGKPVPSEWQKWYEARHGL